MDPMLKNFYGHNFPNLILSLSFCPMQASLSSVARCLWVSPGAQPGVDHLEGASLWQAPALLANIKLCQNWHSVFVTLFFLQKRLPPTKVEPLVGFNYNTDSHKHTSLLKFIIDKGLNNTQQNDTQHNHTQHNDTKRESLFATFSLNEPRHKDTQQNSMECRYEEFGYAVSLF